MRSLYRLFLSQYKLVIAVDVLLAAGILTLVGRPGYAQVLIVAFSVLVAAMLFAGMVRDLWRGKYGIDILAVIAIVSTLLVGEYWATIIIVIMMVGGEALESFAQARAKAELSALLARAPSYAHKQMIDGSLRDIPIHEVKKRRLNCCAARRSDSGRC